MTPTKAGSQFGDTTHTKVFVGGLAWETQKDTMKKYFQQFGEILEAVVITDKITGRSKGYGFVTFEEAEAAMRACVDAAPVIDGRRANCNLASLGLQRPNPSSPNKSAGGKGVKVARGFHQGGFQVAAAYAAATFPHYSVQQGIPFSLYGGYSTYSAEYAYPTSYYGSYGGGIAQHPWYGCDHNNSGQYPAYLNMTEGGAASGFGYGVQYPPQHHFHYLPYNTAPLYSPPYAPLSLAPLQPGMTMALHASIPHR